MESVLRTRCWILGNKCDYDDSMSEQMLAVTFCRSCNCCFCSSDMVTSVCAGLVSFLFSFSFFNLFPYEGWGGSQV